MNPLCGSVNDEQGAQCVSFKGLIYEYIFMFRPSGSLIANLPVPVELCLPVLAKYSHDSRTNLPSYCSLAVIWRVRANKI
eukprot:429309-Pyramimonas_sp.AAC.1